MGPGTRGWRIASYALLFALSGLPVSAQRSPLVPSAGVAAAAETSGTEERPGYLLDLALQEGSCRLLAAAEIENFVETRRLSADDDWLLTMLDAAGAIIGARRIGNPGRHSPILSAEQPLPFYVKIPRITGLASLVIDDQHLRERLRIPVDASFRDAAAANRRAFLAYDLENRRRIAKSKATAGADSARRRTQETSRFENLPRELQRRIEAEIALEIEGLERPSARVGGRLRRTSAGEKLESAATWTITGTVTGIDGTPITGASVLLKHLAATTSESLTWSNSTTSSGHYKLSIPGNILPNNFAITAYKQGYVLQAAGLDISGDLQYDIQLSMGSTLSGTVRDNAGVVQKGARVRAYMDGEFANSALTATDGTYAINLADGRYDIEVLPPSGSTLAPAMIREVSIEGASTLDPVLEAADGILTVKLYFPSEEIYNRFTSRSLVRLELFQSGKTVYAGSGVTAGNGFDETRGRYFRAYTHYLASGPYEGMLFAAGCRPIPLHDVPVTNQAEAPVDIPEPFLWTGVLKGADGAPLANLSIQSYTDLTREYETAKTDAQGKFSILLTPNGFVKFYTDAGSNNILHTERIGDVSTGRNEDVVLDEFPHFSDSGTPLAQIYGVPDRSSRWNIVMIADGYTDVKETFTDTNGNGQWDGVVYYDLNKDGVWNTGEPYQRYGTAAAPISGINPKLKNEPFFDINGDGILSQRDQELFDRNTLDTARSLFGQDEWRRHRDAFNIFRIRLVSQQAGHKVRDQSGKTVIDRNTVLGTYLHTPERNYLFSANTTLVSQYINQYVPECDTRIVFVNQPIRLGRVNSYMFQFGGDISTLCNDYVVAHEMGHNVGLLADEYTEYQYNYVGSESASRNMTSLSDPALIPWRYLLWPGKEIPSIAGSRGIGLFEGAGYYTGGRYRPTDYCMMVSGNRYCPVCTEEIEIRLSEITGVVPDALPLAPAGGMNGLAPEFSWGRAEGVSHWLLEVERTESGQLVASYDVYNTSFSLPVALVNGWNYRWRLRPGSRGNWGTWSAWMNFLPQSANPVFMGFFAQIAAGGYFQTELTAINTGTGTADVAFSLFRNYGGPYEPNPGTAFLIGPLGSASFLVSHPGDVQTGYGRIASSLPIDGIALFKMMSDGLVLSEAGVLLSRPVRNFFITVDNTERAYTGYAIANQGSAPTDVRLILRDRNGVVRDRTTLPLVPGEHFAEYAAQRFPAAAPPGFEGSIEFISDREVAAVALRYDNVHLDALSQVFSAIPVHADDASTSLCFPQVVDGMGYRSTILLVNPQGADTTVARIEFFGDDGTPLALPIAGELRTSVDLPLPAKGVAHLHTDGISSEMKVGWVRVTSPAPIFGSAIFQTRYQDRILSEAGVAASTLTTRFVSYMESLGSTYSGVAICNPNAFGATMTLNLRTPAGALAATTSLLLPPWGHTAKFFTEWFPAGFDEFSGTLEVISTAPVGAVAMRYDNPQMNVFATLPVVNIPATDVIQR